MHYFSSRPVYQVSMSKIVKRKQRKKLHDVGDAGIAFSIPAENRGKSPGSATGRASKSDGSFTKGQRRRMQQALEIYYYHLLANGKSKSKKGGKSWLKSSFITLTIIDQRCLIDSRYGYYKLLRPFLAWMEYHYGVTAFVWVYEKQMKTNQQGHWHLLINRYIDHEVMRCKWYELLKKEGLTEIWDKTHNYIPKPCLEVKGMQSGKMLRNYFAKYFTKTKKKDTDGNEVAGQKSVPSTGRWWGSSAWIKAAEPIVIPYSNRTDIKITEAVEDGEVGYFEKIIPELDSQGLPKMDLSGKVIGYTACEIFRLKGKPATKYLSRESLSIYNAYMKAYRECNADKTFRLKWQYELSLVKHWKDFIDPNQFKSKFICLMLESQKMVLSSYGRELPLESEKDNTSQKSSSIHYLRELASKLPYSYSNRLQVEDLLSKTGDTMSKLRISKKGKVSYQAQSRIQFERDLMTSK